MKKRHDLFVEQWIFQLRQLWIAATVIIVVLAVCRAADAGQWSLLLGGTGNEEASAIERTADGGYIAAGFTEPSGGTRVALVVKVGADGTVAWQKTYGTSSEAHSIRRTTDGGYIVAGYVGGDPWLLKLRADGTVEWQKSYLKGEFYEARQTTDGGYVAAGYTDSSDPHFADFKVIKISSSGATIWQKTYGAPGEYEIAHSIRQTADGGYVVAGAGKGPTSNDARVIKLNSDGSVAWQKRYGGSGDDAANSVEQTADGGYIVAGYTNSLGGGGLVYDAWVLKLNADGTVDWEKAYGTTYDEKAATIRQTADGGYIMAGYTGYGGVDKVWLLKLESDGSIAWQKRYDGSGVEGANDVLQSADGGYVVAGYTGDSGINDLWVLKLDGQGGISGCAPVTVGPTSVVMSATFFVDVDTTASAVSSQDAATDTDAVDAAAGLATNRNCSYAPAFNWLKTYGGPGDDRADAVQQTSDGGYIAAGYKTASAFAFSHGWLLKLNADGSLDWQKTYAGSSTDIISSVSQTSDGGYVTAGYTNSAGAGSNDFWLLKVDSSGNIGSAETWKIVYGGPGDDRADAVHQTSDGGYIVAGSSTSFLSAADNGALVAKLDASGSVQWSYIYADDLPTRKNVADAVLQTSDGGYIVAGYTYSSSYDAWVMKLDQAGAILWQKSYGTAGDDRANDIQQTADGGYIMAGYTDPFVSDADAWVVKLKADGSIDWQKSYGIGTDDRANEVRQTPEGGYIVAGYTDSSYGSGHAAAWLLRLDYDGSILWQKTYGGTADEKAAAIGQASDGGYVAAGYTTSSGAGAADFWVAKLDQFGNVSGCGDISSPSVVTQVTTAVENAASETALSPPSISGYSISLLVSATSVTPASVCSASYTLGLLGVIFSGTGMGSITISPAGIDCTDDCAWFFPSGSAVTLTPVPDPRGTFLGWSGACDANGQVILDSDKTCVAAFGTPADFSGTPLYGAAPLVVSFADSSSNRPYQWSWDFGDSESATGVSPSHIYRLPGLYTVILTATGPGGASRARKVDYVTVAPCNGKPAKILGDIGFIYTDTLGEAYADLSTSGSIYLEATEFFEDDVFSRNVAVTLLGGHSCGFGSRIGDSVIKGSLTIGGGSGAVTVDSIGIE